MSGPTIAELIDSDPRLAGARATLAAYATRLGPGEASITDGLERLKHLAVEDGDQALARACWCLRTIARAQALFTGGFARAQEGDFYGFWCELEQCEIALKSLAAHYAPEADTFGLQHLAIHVERFQGLFPYQYFISPGMVVREAVCSVCDEPMTLRGGCGHVVGEIYDGEMCCRVIRGADILEMSIVQSPVQKYSVLFGPDVTYDYGPVRYVVAGLRSPWHGWSYVERTMPDSSEAFPGASRNDPCPCGSGRKYKRCCRELRAGRRHIDVVFDEGPSPSLPRYLADASYRVTGPPLDVRGPHARGHDQ